jgi:hypothetical protein
MREVHAAPSLEEVLQQDAANVRAWVRATRMQEQALPGQFNWLGLAEAAAFNAREFADKVPGPSSRFPQPQRDALLAASIREQADLAGADEEMLAWLRAAIPALLWAQTAIAVYDFLTGKTAARERRGYQASAMNLRAYLISRLGAVPGDRVLDGDDLLFYFFDGLRLSPGEAREKAVASKQRLRNREHSPRLTRDLQLLRGVKNRLAPVALAVESGQIQPTPALQTWLVLREQLP